MTDRMSYRCATVLLAVILELSPYTSSVKPSVSPPRKGHLCKWKTTLDAYSEIYDRCLRLSTRPCRCDPPACVSHKVNYRVTELDTDALCANQITWCSWGPWVSRSFVVHGNDCLRVSMRRRTCCVKNADNRLWRYLWMSSDDPKWRCAGSNEDKDMVKYSCSSGGIFGTTAVLPLTLFAIVISILILITCGILVRIVCGTRLNTWCHRALGFVRQDRRNDVVAEPHAPPSYDDAIVNSTALPTYDEAMGSNMQLDSLPRLPGETTVDGEAARPPEMIDTSQGICNMAMDFEEEIGRPPQDPAPVPEVQDTPNLNEGSEEMDDNSHNRRAKDDSDALEDLSSRVKDETRSDPSTSK